MVNLTVLHEGTPLLCCPGPHWKAPAWLQGSGDWTNFHGFTDRPVKARKFLLKAFLRKFEYGTCFVLMFGVGTLERPLST